MISLNLAAITAMLFSPLTSLRHAAGAKRGGDGRNGAKGKLPLPFPPAFFVWAYNVNYRGCPVLKAQNFDMLHRTEFGGFLVCCVDSPPSLKWR